MRSQLSDLLRTAGDRTTRVAERDMKDPSVFVCRPNGDYTCHHGRTHTSKTNRFFLAVDGLDVLRICFSATCADRKPTWVGCLTTRGKPDTAATAPPACAAPSAANTPLPPATNRADERIESMDMTELNGQPCVVRSLDDPRLLEQQKASLAPLDLSGKWVRKERIFVYDCPMARDPPLEPCLLLSQSAMCTQKTKGILRSLLALKKLHGERTNASSSVATDSQFRVLIMAPRVQFVNKMVGEFKALGAVSADSLARTPPF